MSDSFRLRVFARLGFAALAGLSPAQALAQAQAQLQTPAAQSSANAAPQAELGSASGLSHFLQQVARNNLDLLVQQLGVPIADAQISIARMFPDPQLNGGITQIDISGQGQPVTSTLGVMVPLEMGGKRGARVQVAVSDAKVARAQLEDFLRTLRADAATAYIDALYTRLVRERKQRTLASLEKLVSINEQRLRVGDIGEVTLLQSRVEAERFRGEVLAAQAEVRAAELKVAQFLGSAERSKDLDVASLIHGELRIVPPNFVEEELVATAREKRPDVLAQKITQAGAGARVRLARANRFTDIDLNLSWARALANPSNMTPAFDALSATATVTLPFSRIYRGELDAALRGEERAGHQLGSAELRAEVEVRTALVRYRAAVDQVKLYTQGVLAGADHVLAATLYTYQRGSATQLEVLNAQRTVDEIYLAYYSALADHAKQLVLVEEAAGIWDISF